VAAGVVGDDLGVAGLDDDGCEIPLTDVAIVPA